MEFVSKNFRNETVQLDGNSFENCVFDDVVFNYAGGMVSFSRCTFKRVLWAMDGDLGRGLRTLGLLLADRPEIAIRIVQGVMFGPDEAVIV